MQCGKCIFYYYSMYCSCAGSVDFLASFHSTMIATVLFIGGIISVILGANLLVEGASSLAKRLGLSDLVIGLTVVAFGTSAPELVVSIYSTIQGNADIAIGNVVGSNIFNVFLILGVSALVYPLRVSSTTIWKEIPLSLLAAIVLMGMASDHLLDHSSFDGISRSDGISLLGFFAVFMYYTFTMARNSAASELHNTVHKYRPAVSVLMVLGGLTLLVVGGQMLVRGAVDLATGLGISQSVIGLTIVAGGTSLPELATSVVAAYKKKADIAVGNVVGSNIFNIFFILGSSAVVHPLGIGNITQIDFLICIAASLVLFVHSFDFKITRMEGLLLLLLYVGYTWFLVYTA